MVIPRIQDLPPEDMIELATTDYGRGILQALETYETTQTEVVRPIQELLEDAASETSIAVLDIKGNLVQPISEAAQLYARAVEGVLAPVRQPILIAQHRLDSSYSDLFEWASQNAPQPAKPSPTGAWQVSAVHPFPDLTQAQQWVQQYSSAAAAADEPVHYSIVANPSGSGFTVVEWRPSLVDSGSTPTSPQPSPSPSLPSPPPTPAGDGLLPPPSTSLPSVPQLVAQSGSCPIYVVCSQYCPPQSVPAPAPIPAYVPTPLPPGSVSPLGPVPGQVPTPAVPTPPPAPAPLGGAPEPTPPSEVPTGSSGPPSEGEEVPSEGSVSPGGGGDSSQSPPQQCFLPGVEPEWTVVDSRLGSDRAALESWAQQVVARDGDLYPDRSHKWTIALCGSQYWLAVLRSPPPETCPKTNARRPTPQAVPPPEHAITSLMTANGQYSDDVDVGCEGRIIPLGGDIWRFIAAKSYYDKRWQALRESEGLNEEPEFPWS